MTEQQIYETWAPLDSPWSPWVKPVLFTQLDHHVSGSLTRAPALAPDLAASLAGQRLALVINLPGERAAAAGLQLARAGFRPVPLFNTSLGPNAVVSVGGILHALREGGDVLPSLPLPPDAPPAFLLDADRMRETGPALPGKYDNRWLVFPQDFPSARFLAAQNIHAVVLVQESSLRPPDDLTHVMLRWQEDALPLLALRADTIAAPEPIHVEKPARYRALWYHFLAVLGLRRNSAGGFGSVVPTPSQGGGGFA